MTTSILPTENKPIKIDPDGATALEKLIKPWLGTEHESAVYAAVRDVYSSGVQGSFAQIFGPDGYYAEAIAEAVAGE
ncbi:MAG: hypothetical protein R3344_03745 [Acidobacteriota bacterium]|nr:hypothetical protein [Acidobacteriota bacterium]